MASEPNRWLHLRLRREFSEAEFESFCAQAFIWRSLVEATLAVWDKLGESYPAPKYEFFEPLISEDRRMVTLPVGGEWTLGTRSLFENSFSKLLWMHFPLDFQLEAEEGITETIIPGTLTTNWRPLLKVEPVGS